MAVAFPYDILANFPGWSPVFEIMRREEQSRSAGGITYEKDFGDPLWRATYVSRSMSANELDAWRARLDVLDGGQQQFRGSQMPRWAPIAYPNYTWPTSNGFNGNNAVIAAIDANRKETRISGLGGGFRLSTGDMIRVGSRNLHRVVTGGVATSGGVLDDIELRPHFWAETTVEDTVSVRRPFCRMTIVPGSLQTDADPVTGRGSIRFDGLESR